MYTITTFCYGPKYTPIIPYWKNCIETICPESSIFILDKINLQLNFKKYAWWDILRLFNNIKIVKETNKPVVHIDLDIVVKKNIRPLVELDYDIIISREIGGNQAFPKECSEKLGFGICSGFYVIKPRAIPFMTNNLNNMLKTKYNTYSDQETLMNYIVNTPHTVETVNYGKFKNQIINIDGIRICVLDFGIIIRDPIFDRDQYANHINIDNVGGVSNFIRYFSSPLDALPLTCRCGKKHLGDSSECPHIAIRRLGLSTEE